MTVVSICQAGLVQGNDTLKLVLEPEAAAAFCLNEIININTSNPTTNEVNHYLMADCGGGTLDMVAHKLTKRPTGEIYIEEIYRARGGPYGGFAVNDEFERMLQRMLQLSADDLRSVKYKHPRQWNKLVSEQFEISKCMVNPKKSHDVFTIRFPRNLCSTIENLKGKQISELVKLYKWHNVEWDDDENELILPYGTMDGLLSPVATKIIAVLDDILQKPECELINKIILVGGFAESSLLFSKIESKFAAANITVKRSATPWLAVLKGAVLSAKTDLIHSRKMSQTLGIETWDEFKPGFHKENKKVMVNGKCLCKNKFTKFVEINQSVKTSHTFEHVYPPVESDGDQCKIKIYGCSHDKPVYTDDVGCYPVAVIDVNLSKCDADKPKEIRVIMHVSGTEINVTAMSTDAFQPLPVQIDLVLDKFAEKRK